MAKNGIEWKSVEEVIGTKESPNLPEGVAWEDRQGWIKLTGSRGCSVYIAKQKMCRHVHFSGFGERMPGTVPPDRENGRVVAQLDMDDPNALRYLAAVLKALPTMAPTVPDRRGQRPTVTPPVGEEPEPRQARASSPPAPRAARSTDAAALAGDHVAAAKIAQRKLDRLNELAAKANATPDPATVAKLNEVIERGRLAAAEELRVTVAQDAERLSADVMKLLDLVEKPRA